MKFWILPFILMSCMNHPKEITIVDENMKATIEIGDIIKYAPESKINRGDIIVLDLPNSSNPSCLRVYGIPKDRVEVFRGIILVNNIPQKRINTSKMLYTVYSKHATDFSKLGKYDFKDYSDKYGIVSLTMSELAEIKNAKIVDSIYELGADSTYVYPQVIKVKSSKYLNHYFFGPVFLPQVDDTIYDEDRSLIKAFSDSQEDHFLIKEDYYFCIGDNFLSAMDSRILGLIPRSKIIGKVIDVRHSKTLNIPASVKQ